MTVGLSLGPEFDWQRHALCAQRKATPAATRRYADHFFPTGRPSAAFKKELCGSCPVREACLNYAVAHDEPGVWGGTTQSERQLMKGRSR